MARASIEHGHDDPAPMHLSGPPGFALPQFVHEVYLWPCNVQAWQCWCDLQTQWRVGVAGATGLDYAGVRAYLDEEGLAGDSRRDVVAGIRAAERAALEVWAQQRERDRDRANRPG